MLSKLSTFALLGLCVLGLSAGAVDLEEDVVDKIYLEEDVAHKINLEEGVVHKIISRSVLCAQGIGMVTVKGWPKTGTTWHEYLIADLMETYCRVNSRVCTASGKAHEFSGLVLRFLAENCTLVFHINSAQGGPQRVRDGDTLPDKHSGLVDDTNNTMPTDVAVVYSVRDPRDTVISHCYWHLGHDCVTNDYTRGSFLNLIDDMALNTRRAQELGQLVMPYEASMEQPMLAMYRLSHYLGLPLSPHELMGVYKRNEFDAMRSIGELEGRKELPGDVEMSRIKARNGKIGGFADDLLLKTIRWADRQISFFMPPEWSECYLYRSLRQPCFPNVVEREGIVHPGT